MVAMVAVLSLLYLWGQDWAVWAPQGQTVTAGQLLTSSDLHSAPRAGCYLRVDARGHAGFSQC